MNTGNRSREQREITVKPLRCKICGGDCGLICKAGTTKALKRVVELAKPPKPKLPKLAAPIPVSHPETDAATIGFAPIGQCKWCDAQRKRRLVRVLNYQARQRGMHGSE